MDVNSDGGADRRRSAWRFGLWLLVLLAPCLGFVALMIYVDRFGQRVDSDGQPSASLFERTLHAVALYKHGLAPHIICTGGVGDYPPAEAVAARSLALALGVPDRAIVVEDRSKNTWDNIANALAICKLHGWSSVVIVSEPYHMWRALRYCRDQGLTAFPSPTVNDLPRVRLFMTAREALIWLRDRCELR
jgi:uncharacterized SAM-binding protein YcdF (DUF218 family)